MKKPQMLRSDDACSLEPGYFHVVIVSSDGKDMDVRIHEWITPHMTEELINRLRECIPDAFYRVRPDLRRQ
jgi:hypothetical protein